MSTIEVDVMLSRDGVLLIAHDSTLNPDMTRDPQEAGFWMVVGP